MNQEQSQEFWNNVLKNQNISVKLCYKSEDNTDENNVMNDITCFYGICIKVFKKIVIKMKKNGFYVIIIGILLIILKKVNIVYH